MVCHKWANIDKSSYLCYNEIIPLGTPWRQHLIGVITMMSFTQWNQWLWDVIRPHGLIVKAVQEGIYPCGIIDTSPLTKEREKITVTVRPHGSEELDDGRILVFEQAYVCYRGFEVWDVEYVPIGKPRCRWIEKPQSSAYPG